MPEKKSGCQKKFLEVKDTQEKIPYSQKKKNTSVKNGKKKTVKVKNWFEKIEKVKKKFLEVKNEKKKNS